VQDWRHILASAPAAELEAELKRRALLEKAQPALDVAALAARLGLKPGALAQRLKRPAWAWLRILGDRGPRKKRKWRWADVEAAPEYRR
jgi:hypothetical protein